VTIIAATITTPLIVSDFHTGKPWRKLSKEHKTLRCIDCRTDKDITSGHILPASRFKMSRLWMSNLVAQCRSCNAKLGNKIRWSMRAVQLLVVYGAMKFIYWTIIILYFSLTTAVMVMDISTGGMETSFTGQVLIGTLEQIQQLTEYL